MRTSDIAVKLELARAVLREIVKHPDFWPPRALKRQPWGGEICPQCGVDDLHHDFCIIGAIQDVLGDGQPRERERVGPVRIGGAPVTVHADRLRHDLSKYEGQPAYTAPDGKE